MKIMRKANPTKNRGIPRTSASVVPEALLASAADRLELSAGIVGICVSLWFDEWASEVTCFL